MIKPNYVAASKEAHNLIIKNNIRSFPIPLEKIYKPFTNLRVRSYSWFAKKRGIDISEVISIADSESGCCWYMPEQGRYLILYNDTINNLGHIRWTIAHELGHYILKHNEKTDKTIISRNSLSKSEYRAFEQEANCFARELLSPYNVLIAINRYFDSETLVEWCDVSNKAATNILKFFNKGRKMGRVVKPNDKLVELFSDYIYLRNNERHCIRCKHYFVEVSATNCPICGGKRLLRRKGAYTMIYDGYDLDENGRPSMCPRCENERIGPNDEYCRICKLQIVNRCDNIIGYEDETPIYCNTPASGDARYCVKCGGETTYLQQGLLKPWDEIINPDKEKRKEKVGAIVGSSRIIEISDEDLPF